MLQKYRAVYRSEEMVSTAHLKGYVDELLEIPGVLSSSTFPFSKGKRVLKTRSFPVLRRNGGAALTDLYCTRQKEMIP